MKGFQQNEMAIVLFAGFAILYMLELVIPLVRRESRHLLSNISLACVLILLNLVFASFILITGEWVAGNKLGLFNQFELDTAWVIIGSIVLLDFWSGYLVHILLHKFPWLWTIHSVHHSDDLVDVTTTFRQHPIETFIRLLFNLTGMIVFGIPVWVLLLYTTLSTIHAQIEHANISIPARIDKVLQIIFVTPNMHKVHHSKYQRETDSNFSNIFSVWDRLFKTFRVRKDYASIDYGLDYLGSREHISMLKLLKLPFTILKKKTTS